MISLTGGQPEAVAISPDENYVAVAIENERNEDRDEELGGGGLPQMPAGFLALIDSSKRDPKHWSVHQVNLTGVDGADTPEDPEPKYVDFNHMNEVVVTLQENNAIAIVNAETKEVTAGFTAGMIDQMNVDTIEDRIINQCSALVDVVREPDAGVWVDDDHFVTADEGDWKGGSRTVTMFDKHGEVVWHTGNVLEHIVAAYGQYPDERSENKGNEPETVYVKTFGVQKYLFTASERSNLVFVMMLDEHNNPTFTQALPVGTGPEGIIGIPHRNLLVVGSEVDRRGDNIRASLSIFKYEKARPDYPTIASATTSCKALGSEIPIPFGALSGLALDPMCDSVLYSIEDSFYSSNRFFKIDASQSPAVLYEGTKFMDTNGILGDFASKCKCFSEHPVNDDKSVNVDPEGIAVYDNGVILVVSEGDTREGREKPNYVIGLDKDGVIIDVWTLPNQWNMKAKRWGFEGVAIDSSQKMVVVAGQVPWGPGESAAPSKGDDPGAALHIFLDGVWSGFVYYPLDEPESQNGGWVGIGDISPLGNKQFAVLERDNQGGPDAAIKKVYTIDLSHWSRGDIVKKMLWKDLMDDLAVPNGFIPTKIEGLACMSKKGCWVVNDNDGVDDNSGETQLLFVERH